MQQLDPTSSWQEREGVEEQAKQHEEETDKYRMWDILELKCKIHDFSNSCDNWKFGNGIKW